MNVSKWEHIFSIILWANYPFNQTTKTEYDHERSGTVLALSTRQRAKGGILFQGVLAPEDSSMKGYPGGLSPAECQFQFPGSIPQSSCEPQIA